MTKSDDFEVPKHLNGVLELHSTLSKRLKDGGDDLTPLEITKLKKRKLVLRDAIAKVSYDYLRGPIISDSVLYPLTVDTLQLLKNRVDQKLQVLKRSLSSTSHRIAATELVLNRIVSRISQLSQDVSVDAEEFETA